MITVGVDAADVERRLGEGRLRCPGCEGRLGGWGHARERVVRGLAEPVRPRRTRCRSCRRTQVLLPVTCWSRRADCVEVIGVAFSAKAAGAGHRQIARGLGRAPETVRGWLRRLGGRLEAVRSFFTARMVAVAIEPVLPEPTGSAWGDAVAAVASVASAIAQRFGGDVVAVTGWQTAAAATGGALLSPGWGLSGSGRGGNTS